MTSVIIKRLVGVLAAVALALGMTAGLAKPAEAKKTVWDKVAACESGGNWKINTGNGFYGGLQFSPRTWSGHGGKKYASKAHKASKAEQIAIARRVLASQGRGAWPTCGRKAGLTKSNGKAAKHATPSSNPGAKHDGKSNKAKKDKKDKKSDKKKHKKHKKKAHKKHHKKTIKVRSGDTLGKIAKRHHVKGGWKALWKLNKKKVKNPHNLQIGQKLIIRK